MKYRHLKIGGVLLFVMFFFWSCDAYMEQFNMDNISTEMDLTPSFAGPLAHGSFSVQNILEALNDSSGLISQTNDSLIYIFYADTAFSLDASLLLAIPDHIGSETYISTDINIPEWLAIDPGTQYNFYKQENLDFAISDGDKIDSIFLKAGILNLTAFSEFKHGGILSITSSGIRAPNGDSLVLDIPITTNDGTFRADEMYDLSDYTLILTEEAGMAYVKININLKLVKSAAGLSVDEEAGINLSFEDIDYKVVYGFIAGREITELSQSIDIGFFESLDNIPSIYFASPRFTVAVHNSIGVPLSMNINSFKSRSAVSGEYVDLTFKNDTMMPFTIYAPGIDQIGQTITTYRDFNVATCNIDEILSNIPDKIDFSFAASTGNPPGSTEQNFVLDSSKMSLALEVYMPFHLSTSGYTLRQPLDFDLEALKANISMINNAKFTLKTINEWPIGISIQIYFLDIQGTVVDSLFDNSQALLAAAPVTENGELDRALLVENPFVIELSQEKLKGMEGATQLMLEASAATSENGTVPVKFYSNYRLKYELSIDAEFKINPSEL